MRIAVFLWFAHYGILAAEHVSSAGNVLDNDPVTRPVLHSSEILSSVDQGPGDRKRSYPDLTVLGFITPWNKAGVEVAYVSSEHDRLDIAAPVTFQVSPSGVEGGHDFGNEFYWNLTNGSSPLFSAPTRVYPRFVFEKWSLTTLLQLRRRSKELNSIVASVVSELQTRGCDGAVLEIWQSFLAAGGLRVDPDGDPRVKDMALDVLSSLGSELRAAGIEAILVLPPYDTNTAKQSGLVPADFGRLKSSFEFFVVMTYDFSVPGSGAPGPIAPLRWCEGVLQFLVNDSELGSKVLLGLNFYGADFERDSQGGRHIVGHEYVALLKEYEPDIAWLDEYGEDAFAYKDSRSGTEHVVFYPTRRSLQARLRLARRAGCGGVAIWELGQGLPFFMEEL
jgi:chitinase domain-containing protein 1